MLHRVVGSRAIMRAKLERLLELGELPNVTLRVIPYEGRCPAGGEQQVHHLEIRLTDVKDVVFIEGLTGDLYLEDPGDVEIYNTTFRTRVHVAKSPDKTRRSSRG